MTRRPYDAVKRMLDVVAAGAGLVLLSPVIGATAVLVRWRLGAPVLFRQRRPGKDGEIFELVKFRSMLEVDEARGRVTDAQRLTSFGQTLRASSLDELPSLWNVLRGEMSIVGPRPLLVSYLDLYSPMQARRHEVRPGITGLAQVSGRNALGWEERLALDVAYVDNRSFTLDAKIIARTLLSVMRRDGISAPGHVTMAEFAGSADRGDR